ncbi:MAG: hypothetical protein IJL06_03605 [Kiritimatiellae bacterium]|nr:hypothetical protein [Kiritimatiellia bacterium]
MTELRTFIVAFLLLVEKQGRRIPPPRPESKRKMAIFQKKFIVRNLFSRFSAKIFVLRASANEIAFAFPCFIIFRSEKYQNGEKRDFAPENARLPARPRSGLPHFRFFARLGALDTRSRCPIPILFP